MSDDGDDTCRDAVLERCQHQRLTSVMEATGPRTGGAAATVGNCGDSLVMIATSAAGCSIGCWRVGVDGTEAGVSRRRAGLPGAVTETESEKGGTGVWMTMAATTRPYYLGAHRAQYREQDAMRTRTVLCGSADPAPVGAPDGNVSSRQESSVRR